MCLLLTLSSFAVLIVLLFHIAKDGLPALRWDFFTSFPSRFAEQAGIKSALFGSLWVIMMTVLFSIPLGVASAIYLEEYARPNRFITMVEINLANLAGIPSIIFGILGLVFFVKTLQLGKSVLAGSLTMTLLVLPIVIITAKEAIRSVPYGIREAAFAVGASRWQTVAYHVIPSALPGIFTGMILCISRAIGETAPLIVMGALTYIPFIPSNPMDSFTVLPIQIFNWASRPQSEFHALAAAGILVLIVVLLLLNGFAIYFRDRTRRRLP